MRKIIATLLTLAVLWDRPAVAGIAVIPGTGTGSGLVDTTVGAGSSVNLVTTHDAPPGSLVVVPVTSNTAGTADFPSCTDSASNTWQSNQTTTAASGAGVRIFWSYLANDLPSGGTITCNITGVTTIIGAAMAFSGASSSPYDPASSSGKTQNGVTGSITVGPTGTLNGPCGSANCEVLICAAIWSSGGTVTQDSNYTNFNQFNTGSGVTVVYGYWIVSTNAARSCTNSTTATANFSGQLQGFIAPSARRSLAGVGK